MPGGLTDLLPELLLESSSVAHLVRRLEVVDQLEAVVRMRPSNDALNLAEMAAVLQGDYDAPMTGDRIIANGLELVPDADHASLTIRQEEI